MLAQSTGWATAARAVRRGGRARSRSSAFGARHVHPDITDVLDYAAIVGGCVGASTPAGARLAGLNPTGTMPHSLVLIFGDTVRAAEAFDRDMPPDVPRIVLVDTFRDEAEEALRVAKALGDRLYGIRLDTPSERGRVTADLVTEIRARLDQEGYGHVTIVVSGGLTPDRIRYFKDSGAPVDSFAVGTYITGATPIDFTGDIKEIDGRPIAKRGRIPGMTDSPRLRPPRPRRAGATDRPRRRSPAGASGPAMPARRPTAARCEHAHAATTCPAGSRARRCRRPDEADEPRSAYELLQRGPALMRRRHNAQAAIVLDAGGPPGARQGLDPRGARPGRVHDRASTPVPREDRSRRCSRSTRRRTTGTTPSAMSLKRAGSRPEARTHLRLAVALAPASALYRGALARAGPRRRGQVPVANMPRPEARGLRAGGITVGGLPGDPARAPP